MRPFERVCLIALVGAATLPVCAQLRPVPGQPASPSNWQVDVSATDDAAAQGLPVLALDRPDWPDYRSGAPATARAWRSIRAELGATHPSGWRLAVLTRAEAQLEASADAVTLAALNARHANPSTLGAYAPAARSQSWRGTGVAVRSPWLQLAPTQAWRLQADLALLQLQDLRTGLLAGQVGYRGGGVYDFAVQADRSDPSISGPYLPASGPSGFGASLSLAVEGQPAPGWRVQLRADDLASWLSWADLANDKSTLDSNVVSRAPDGSLDYAPQMVGQLSRTQAQAHMGVHWQADLAWTVMEDAAAAAALTLRASSKAGIEQAWLGWDSGAPAAAGWHWRLEWEPTWQAARLGLARGGWQAALASDGRGLQSQYRLLTLAWRTDF
ncbi:MAG: hypothetical protein WCO22_17825 [Betaproteobacteria bacterium]